MGRSSETMRGVLLTGHGKMDQLEYREDIPIPDVGPADVLVEVSACGVNNTDIWTRKAQYGEDDSGWKGLLDFPIIQGADIVGTIVDTGEQVADSRRGERVIVDSALYANSGGEFQALIEADLIGSERNGGFAEYTSIPAENAHEINCTYSDAELATFPTSYSTAERMLNRGEVDGETNLLVTGASGGVGTGLVQLAQRRGATVTAITSSPKRDCLQDLGIEQIVLRDEEPVADAIVSYQDGGGFDVITDVVGGDLFEILIDVVQPGGRIVTAGAIADPVIQLDLRPIYLKQISVVGSTMATRGEFVDLVDYIENHEIRPVLADSYSLSELPKAQERFLENDYCGKLVITP